MPDSRFFEDLGPVSLAELAALTGTEAPPAAGSRMIRAVAILSQARADTVTFLTDAKHGEALAASKAGACFIQPKNLALAPEGCVPLATPSPQAAYAVAARRLHRLRLIPPGPPVSPDAEFEEEVEFAPGVVLGPGVRVGRGTRIGANSVIGPGVTIGRDCAIAANVTISCALVGDRVTVLAGAAIGEAGFGATVGPGGLMDIPQLGRVILQDGVTVGANACIDRGAFDDTVVGENTKIDNMVQIGHNCRIGRNCAIAAHTGISGSVEVGDGVQMGGRVGIADHATSGAGARLAAAAGVMGDVPAGETWGGFPARPIRRWLREAAWVGRMAAGKERTGE